jgi:hypothetical protein
MCTKLRIIEKSYGNFVPEDVVGARQKVQCILDIHDEICKDDDISKEENMIDNILPIGCIHYHVVTTFSGADILGITGTLNITSLFRDGDKFSDIYPGELDIEDGIAKMFYQSFYEYISNQMTALDVPTEWVLTNSFYDFAESGCTLSHIDTPFGDISFFGSNNDKLMYQLRRIHEGQKTSPYDIREMTYLTFVFKTTFTSFFHLYYNFKDYMIDYGNLKLVFLEKKIRVANPILQKYQGRISSADEFLSSYKKTLNESTEINLNKFNYIFGGNEISYSMKIPLSEIDDFMLSLNQSVKELKDINLNIKNSLNIINSCLNVSL